MVNKIKKLLVILTAFASHLETPASQSGELASVSEAQALYSEALFRRILLLFQRILALF